MTDESAVRALVAQYEAAFNANDASAMNDLFAADPIFVNIAGTLVHGREPLYVAQAFVFDGPLRDVHVRYDVEHITPLGADVVVVHARQRPAHPDGTRAPVDAEHRESVLLLVLAREDGAWRIRVGQNTVVA